MATLLRTFLIYPLLLFIAVVTAYGGWHANRDPLSVLPPPDHNPAIHEAMPVSEDGRHVQHIILTSGPLGDIGIVVSLPDPLPAKKLPLLVVLGGLGTGQNNIRYVKNAGDNVLVGYDWPIPVPFPQGMDLVKQIPDLYKRLVAIPAQVATAIAWLAAQPWADNTRIGVLGFSLGALATPAIETLAAHDGHAPGWTILAYGGATFGALFMANPHMKPEWMRMPLGVLIDMLLHPLDPTVNLPHLTGHFLVLEGRDDALIPAEARLRLRDAVPNPKDVVILNGDHMGAGADKQQLLDQIIRVSRNWLAQSGAINQ